jgi:hypothetical protein
VSARATHEQSQALNRAWQPICKLVVGRYGTVFRLFVAALTTVHNTKTNLPRGGDVTGVRIGELLRTVHGFFIPIDKSQQQTEHATTKNYKPDYFT